MKIIGISNFNLETIDDILIAENIFNNFYAEKIVNHLNEQLGPDSTFFFKSVEDNKKLHVFEP